MPTFEPFYLMFKTGLHVGRHGIGQEAAEVYVPSDTLFAALVAMRAQLKDDAGAWADRFGAQPPFRLTSAFPFAGQVRFYPRPVKKPEGIDGKTWHKIKFVSEALLKPALSAEVPENLWPPKRDELPRDALTVQQGAVWMTRTEIDRLPEDMRTKIASNGHRMRLEPRVVQRQLMWAEEVTPRVMVDRVTNAAEIYHTGRVTFAKDCGVWFGVAWQDRTTRDELLATLRALGDNGLGAERSAGYGAFDFAHGDPFALPDATPDRLLLLLSRFYPREAEAAAVLARAGTAYDLVHYAGYVRSTGQKDQRRREATLIAEGSVIGGGAQGSLVNVKPMVGQYPHAVWRYGLAIGVGVEAQG